VRDEAGHIFGLIGPLAAFPLRAVAREAERYGHGVHRGIRRRMTHLVIGRRLLAATDAAAGKRLQTALASGRSLLSENGFLRVLGLLPAVTARTVDAQSLLAQSNIAENDFDLLRLFDAFECDGEPFTFRDLILARKYAGLIASGARPLDIARSVQKSGSIASLTSKTLHADRKGGVFASFDEGMGELTGQLLFDLGDDATDSEEAAFAEAEALEGDGQYLAASDLYARCLALDPRDSVAAFNRANCLRAAGLPANAAT
jgi:tetratricopeptide (TPR) repeat protein